MINKKTLTVAVVESLSILLFNLVGIAWLFSLGGGPLTTRQQVIQYAISAGLAIVRIAWFYFVLSYADQIENARVYFSNLINRVRK